VTIFNIDTVYHDFRKPEGGLVDYLDVTRLPGSHWSFVEPDPGQPKLARRVVEKERISDLCSVGLYGFSSSRSFYECYTRLYRAEHRRKEEYVAPMYQHLIDDGFPVHYREYPRTQFDFVGTPEDYERYLRAQKRATEG
jgi:dTDP-glucose pyrophosphorylase